MSLRGGIKKRGGEKKIILSASSNMLEGKKKVQTLLSLVLISNIRFEGIDNVKEDAEKDGTP